MTPHWSHGPIACSGCLCGGPLEEPCRTPLLVLSLWQPWATLCVATDPFKAPRFAGPKEWETRHWAPRNEVPFTVVIHAAKRYDGQTRDAYVKTPFREALERCGYYAGDPRPLLKRREVLETLDHRHLRPVPLGALVGVATIREVVSTDRWLEERAAADPSAATWAEERAFGNYDRGRFAWRLVDAFEFETPIPFSGRQDVLYPLEREAAERVHAATLRIAA